MAAKLAGQTAPQLPPDAPRCRLTAPRLKPPVSCETARPLTLIGSRADCDLSLSATDVSKLHCAILNTGRGLIAIDLCSRSGIIVNGKRATVAPLQYGAQLSIGNIVVCVEAADGAAAAQLESQLGQRPLQLLVSGRERTLERLPIIIGRRSQCQVVLDTPDVSLAHALIFELDGCPLLYDLGSRSGTFVNGQRVEAHWLRNNDVLHVGGEELKFLWDGPEFTAPSARAPLGAPAGAAPPPSADRGLPRAAAAPVAAQAGEGTSDDLEGMLAGVHAQVAGVRERLSQRAQEIDAREAQLLRSEAELSARMVAADLAARESARRLAQVQERELALAAAQRAVQEAEQRVAQRGAQVERDAADLQRRSEEAARAQTALAGAQQEFERSRAELLSAQAEVSGARAALTQERAVLAEQQSAWQSADAALRTREIACEDRRVELERREQELQSAEVALQQREAVASSRLDSENEAARKIEQFKSALREASQALSTIDVPRPAAGAAPPRAAAPVAGAAETPIPGPLVEQPLFGGAVAAPVLSPEMQDRLRALRRVSDKSDNELLSQVLAEFAAKPAPPQLNTKRGRN